MPYITKYEKGSLLPESPGELNYEIHLLLDNYIQAHGEDKYQIHNDIMGVLECVKQEFYRRMTAPLEDIKMDENGDVPPYSNSTLCNPCPGSFDYPSPTGEDAWDQMNSAGITLPNNEDDEIYDPKNYTDDLEFTGCSFDKGPVTDPHDGRLGWWRVDGLRHSAIVSASSAQKAIDRADADEHVDKSWEMPMATWIGEYLPNSIRC